MEKLINPDRKIWPQLVQRPVLGVAELEQTVKHVFEDVKRDGDEALSRYTRLYDGVTIGSFQVTEEEITTAETLVSQDLKEAIKLAEKNIERFHASQLTGPKVIETTQGVSCWTENRPVEKVGIYIPGGTAPLFSTVLMLGIPARIAGCAELVLCSPPGKDGSLAPVILYAARLVGIKKIFKIGGIQAIAALTLGTETVPAVYKIFGPGNQYVTAAKQMANREGVAIDLPAGPSELLVMADSTAEPAFVAADLLSQAEHAEDSQVIFLTNDENTLQKVKDQLDKQKERLPRKAIIQKVLNQSKLICMEKKEDCLDFINMYAPEHLILAVKEVSFFTHRLINAGSVFIGNYTPESAGDYASGTNHTLPTNGYARAYSGVNLDAFMKKITFQKISPDGIQSIGPAIELMAEEEGLLAHKQAVTIRLNHLKDDRH